MTKESKQDDNVRVASYRKETTEKEHAKNEKNHVTERRTLMNRPIDPNSPVDTVDFPPGVDPEDAADPGRSTPGAPPVRNRTGKKD